MKKFWKSLNIIHATHITAKSGLKCYIPHKDVTKKLLSHFVQDFSGFQLGKEIKMQQHCNALAKESGEGKLIEL